uniref:General transcription factor IIH subunit 4 n=1 Tax=Meloidogyne enterolobii TaxID=390850 RepID=A0A6V7WZ13_MELEN|nr:unnamed protein product [Meloidogyne enterolobii]
MGGSAKLLPLYLPIYNIFLMMTDSIFNDRPFLEFLATQGEDLIQQLYESQHCVIAIMRMLPFDVQQCLIQLMFIKSKDWFSGNEKMWKQAINSLQLLKKLGILEGDLEHENLRLNLDFRMNYIASLLTSLNKLSGLSSHPLDDKSQKSANKDLLGKSISRWESILCYLALPNETPDKSVSETTRSLFHFIGLIKGSTREPEISSSGFQFLLMSRSEQIWTYLIHYFRFLSSKNEPIFPLIEFFLRLTICIQPNEGKISPQVLDQTWPENIQAFLMTLREIGLIFIRKRKDGWFLLTPLLVEITREIGNGGEIVENLMENKGGGGLNKNGFLIVETNYRIYAYTNSTLQLAIISTFAEIIYRFPNVSIGLLSRDSIRRALQTGITARQICQYLRSNSHPQMQQQHSSSIPMSSTSLIPVTITDQIYLWEQERRRFTCSEEAEFVAFRDFSLENKFAFWYCNISRQVLIDSEWDGRVKDWWTEYRKTL